MALPAWREYSCNLNAAFSVLIELQGFAYPGKSSSCLMIGTNHAVG